jgi:hypothetical protein
MSLPVMNFLVFVHCALAGCHEQLAVWALFEVWPEYPIMRGILFVLVVQVFAEQDV